MLPLDESNKLAIPSTVWNLLLIKLLKYVILLFLPCVIFFSTLAYALAYSLCLAYSKQIVGNNFTFFNKLKVPFTPVIIFPFSITGKHLSKSPLVFSTLNPCGQFNIE